MAAQISPAGPRAAGRFGCSLLSLGATSAGGFDVLGSHWDVMEQRAAEFGTTVDRTRWRLVGPMHIADTREQAMADVAFGLAEWVDYFQRVAALPLAPDTDEPRRPGRRPQRVGHGRHRHRRRRHRPDRAAAGAVRRLRHLPVHGPRVGRHRGHPPLLRAGGPLRDAPVPGDVGTRSPASRDWAAENRPEFIGAAGNAVLAAITSTRRSGRPGLRRVSRRTVTTRVGARSGVSRRRRRSRAGWRRPPAVAGRCRRRRSPTAPCRATRSRRRRSGPGCGRGPTATGTRRAGGR